MASNMFNKFRDIYKQRWPYALLGQGWLATPPAAVAGHVTSRLTVDLQ